jgi:hypothetical protein
VQGMSKTGTTFYLKPRKKPVARRKVCGLTQDILGIFAAFALAAIVIAILVRLPIFQ